MVYFLSVDIEMPETRKLTTLDPVPNWNNVKPLKFQKRLYDMQGPELVHNTLMYKQYGIIVSLHVGDQDYCNTFSCRR